MKKIISLLLSLSIAFCIVSLPASAATQSISLSSIDVTSDAGPWFGDVSNNYSIYVPSGAEKQFQARVTATIYTIAAPFIPSKYVQAVAGGCALALAWVEDDQSSAHTYYITITKRYREISVGGEFSHYETMVITTVYSDSGRSDYLTSDTQIFEGELMMRANEEL